MAPFFSVIIVNYNSGERLARCLDCLGKQSFSDFEIIVIDNASSDGSARPASEDDNVVLISAGSNLGFAAANNLAVKRANSEWLVFLNPDAYAAPDWLVELADAIARRPEADAFGSTQINADDRSILDGAGDVYHAFGIPYRGHYGWPVETLPPEGECFAPCAAAAAYRKTVFEKLGGFDESFFCYGEDVDLGFRLRLSGGLTIQAPRAIVYHEGSGITGRHSDFTVYHGHRNRIWTYYLNMPAALLIVTLPFHMLANIYLLVRFSLNGSLKPYLAALRDGVRALSRLHGARRERQKSRAVTIAQVARMLTWSPLKVMQKKADVRAR